MTSGNETEQEYMEEEYMEEEEEEEEEEKDKKCMWEARLPNEIQQLILGSLGDDTVTHVVTRFVSKGFKIATEELLKSRKYEDTWNMKAREFSKAVAASGNLDLLKWARENGCLE